MAKIGVLGAGTWGMALARMLSNSIDERSSRIDTCKNFDHWECDLVLWHKC